ncbi:MAG: sulfotransferase, partial [Woeseiaceae bacterium]
MTTVAARIKRKSRQFELMAGWLRRDIAWHFYGRSYYTRHVDELLNARKWVFLAGCNNSGTTILHDLLVSSGRFTALPHEGQRYTRQLAIAERRGFERVWTEYLADLRMTEADSTSIVPRLVYDWLFEAAPKDRDLMIEKTTANSVRMRWLQKAIPKSYFIGVVRNGFAVAEGIRRKGHKDIARAARHWAKVNEIMRSDSQFIRNYLQLRYEDIVGTPQQVVASVSEFLD